MRQRDWAQGSHHSTHWHLPENSPKTENILNTDADIPHHYHQSPIWKKGGLFCSLPYHRCMCFGESFLYSAWMGFRKEKMWSFSSSSKDVQLKAIISSKHIKLGRLIRFWWLIWQSLRDLTSVVTFLSTTVNNARLFFNLHIHTRDKQFAFFYMRGNTI